MVAVDAAKCVLTLWEGDPNKCRQCGTDLLSLGSRKNWCGGDCLALYRRNHRYYLARQECLKRSKGKCSCVREPGEQRHAKCAHCGDCEVVVKGRNEQLEANHIVPRLGDRTSFSCNHHPDNLELLCSSCHWAETELQQLRYPQMKTLKGHGRRAA